MYDVYMLNSSMSVCMCISSVSSHSQVGNTCMSLCSRKSLQSLANVATLGDMEGYVRGHQIS